MTMVTHAGRVLIVDDNADLASVLRRGLEVLGFVVETAADGLTALERAATFQPQIAMIDIALPLINGWEVARRLRRVDRLRSTRLIAMSGMGDPAHRERSLAAGFADHLCKPLKLTQVADAIARNLEARNDGPGRRSRPDSGQVSTPEP